MVSIKVDEPQEDQATPEIDLWSPSLTPTNNAINILASAAPSQPLHVYQLSALIPPLLSAILESTDSLSPSTPIETLHRLYRLLNLIVAAKPDSYLDLLEIIAYHTTQVRMAALRILGTYWPSAVGHAFVGKPLHVMSYDYEVALRHMRHSRMPTEDHGYNHQFLAWSFEATFPGQTNVSSESKRASSHQNTCDFCNELITGFGLVCLDCTSAVHLQCYDPPDGSFMTMYPSPRNPDTQKVSMTRFSCIGPHTKSALPAIMYRENHSLRPVTLFTLTPCFACRDPLWGCHAQALACTSCRQFLHHHCATSPDLPRCRTKSLSAASLTVEWRAYQTSFQNHYQGILLDESQISRRSHEEISIAYGILWTQLQLHRNGVAGGSLIVERNGPRGQEGILELQDYVKLYSDCLLSGRLHKSETLDEFQRQHEGFDEHQQSSNSHSILFDRSLMMYISALIKSPRESSISNNPTTSFLSVTHREVDEPHSEDSSHPFELVVLSHMREILGFELNIYLEAAARHLLSHLNAMGWFRRLDQKTELFDASSRPSETYCVFPLPVIIDYSTSVETLVSAIDICLQDLDITLNEIGFLWMMKRCWPNGMTSDYALHRLTGLVVSWIVSEVSDLPYLSFFSSLKFIYILSGRPSCLHCSGLCCERKSTTWTPHAA